MKVLLVFALYGLTCNLVASVCPEEELQECPKGPDDKFITNEEDLNKLCRKIKCYLDVATKHGCSTETEFSMDTYGNFDRFICDKNGLLRKKFLNNAKCIADAMTGDKDVIKDCGIKAETREEFCRTITSGMRCAKEYISGKCGKGAALLLQLSNPDLNSYPCH